MSGPNGRTGDRGGPLPAVNRLAKWRAVLSGWQLGTRAKGDPESDAVRDHREVTLVLRAEMSALAALLIDRQVFTAEEYVAALEQEAAELSEDLSRRFPGFTATDEGMSMDRRAVETMKGWRP